MINNREFFMDKKRKTEKDSFTYDFWILLKGDLFSIRKKSTRILVYGKPNPTKV